MSLHFRKLFLNKSTKKQCMCIYFSVGTFFVMLWCHYVIFKNRLQLMIQRLKESVGSALLWNPAPWRLLIHLASPLSSTIPLQDSYSKNPSFYRTNRTDTTSLDAWFQLFPPIAHSKCSPIIPYGTCWALLHGLKLSAGKFHGKKRGPQLPPNAWRSI